MFQKGGVIMIVNLEKFKWIVINSGFTVSELSSTAGVSRATVHRINSGISVKPVTIGKLARALGVKAEDLI